MTIHQLLRKRLHERAGLFERTFPGPNRRAFPYSAELIDFIRRHKWSQRFEEAMRLRLAMGGMRYETPDRAALGSFVGRPTKIQTEDILRRIRAFQKDGNTEHLVDAANLCMIEFETTDHPLAHFEGTDRKE